MINPINSSTLKGRLLVVDDEQDMRIALGEALRRAGWEITLAENAARALECIEHSKPFDLVLSDMRMGAGLNGLELMKKIKKQFPQIPVVIMTAYGAVEDAVEAMRGGASDYLLKPFSVQMVTDIIDRAIENPLAPLSDETISERHSASHEALGIDSREHPCIVKSAAMQTILLIADSIADTDSTVLLNGESGSGKEVIARYIHEKSGRTGPFIAVNCAALPDGLLESELFGHDKGAFTGAVLARKGRFEQAENGTLLLDEITEMPLALQAKLLRVLQEKEVTPIGSTQTIKVNARIIATSNRDLEQSVSKGEFRQDLYYRLNVIALPLPPLRERRDDILPLAEYFLDKRKRAGRKTPKLSDEVCEYLLNYSWPGNVRELGNMMERAGLLARGEIVHLEDLHLKFPVFQSVLRSPAIQPFEPPKETTSTPLEPLPAKDSEMTAMSIREALKDNNTRKDLANSVSSWNSSQSIIDLSHPMTLEEVERRLIMHTLDVTGGNRTRAADMLGVSVRTIRNKLHQYGVETVGAEA